jgi:hypothetical protein
MLHEISVKVQTSDLTHWPAPPSLSQRPRLYTSSCRS